MPDFECYCFLCSGPLSTWKVGSSSTHALRRRRRRVEKKRLALLAGKTSDPDESDNGGDGDDGDDADDQEDEDEERYSYDPELATSEKTSWLDHLRVLGVNPRATGSNKAFISGPASYDDAGRIDVTVGSDPNQPSQYEEPYFDCYNETCDIGVVFPFHLHCMAVLKQAFEWLSVNTGNTGKSQKTSQLDLDILYDVASRLTEPYGVALNLDYGDISEADEFWESIPGEEAIADPLQFPSDDFSRGIRSLADRGAPSSQPRAVVDPFETLPNEILHAICHLLHGKDLRAFLTASATVHCATRDPVFWKTMCASRAAWAWEFWKDMGQETDPPESQINYKKLYLLLEKKTSQGFGMALPMSDWLGMTNRRRIWNVCLQLLQHYKEALEEAIPDTDSAWPPDFVRQSEDVKLFRVAYPPSSGPVLRTQLLYSREEMKSKPADFEAYWDPEGNLVGLGLSIDSSIRILDRSGSWDQSSSHITKTAARIDAKDWITGFILHIRISRPLRGTAVRGITAILNKGNRIELGDHSSSLCVRRLLPASMLHIFGIVGQTGHNGVIASLGIVQDGQCQAPPRKPEFGEMLWTSSALSVPTRGPTFSNSEPIWAHPFIAPEPVVDPAENDPMVDFTANDIFLWAKDDRELGKLERISAWIMTDPGNGGILGLRSSYVRRYWEPKRYVGFHEEDGSGELPDSDRRRMVDFDVDGPGGERIVEVGLQCSGGEVKAIKLRSNHGRQAIFGQEETAGWATKTVSGERVLFGLTAAFSVTVNDGDAGPPKLTSLMMLTKADDTP